MLSRNRSEGDKYIKFAFSFVRIHKHEPTPEFLAQLADATVRMRLAEPVNYIPQNNPNLHINNDASEAAIADSVGTAELSKRRYKEGARAVHGTPSAAEMCHHMAGIFKWAKPELVQKQRGTDPPSAHTVA